MNADDLENIPKYDKESMEMKCYLGPIIPIISRYLSHLNYKNLRHLLSIFTYLETDEVAILFAQRHFTPDLFPKTFSSNFFQSFGTLYQKYNKKADGSKYADRIYSRVKALSFLFPLLTTLFLQMSKSDFDSFSPLLGNFSDLAPNLIYLVHPYSVSDKALTAFGNFLFTLSH
jgi:hypothetical protein